jgi:ATP-binding cassette, subfamily B, bacterial MsbA
MYLGVPIIPFISIYFAPFITNSFMKRFSRILYYLRAQRLNIVGYFLFNLLSVVFSLASLSMLAPFLQLLFSADRLKGPQPVVHFSINSLLEYLKYYFGQLIVHHGEAYALGAICVILVATILLKNVFSYLSYRVLSPIRNYVMTKLRADLFIKILELPIGYFTEQRKGDIFSRMSNDANELEWSVISTVEGLIREPVTIIIILTSLVMISPVLSLFLLVMLPITGWIIGRVSRSLKKQSGRSQEKLGALMSIVEETLGGLRVLKAFNAEETVSKRFYSLNNSFNRLRNRMNFRKDLASPLSEFLAIIVLSCILWFGGRLVLGSTMLQADAFITYIVFFTQIISPAKSLSTAFYNVQRGGAAIARIEEVLQAPVTITESDSARLLEGFNDSIEFKNVSFSYDEEPVLQDINLRVAKGKIVALVGSSGSGKSTLCDLVPRFHDVTSGELLIDGTNVKAYTLTSLRDQIAIVTQEPILFNDTIRENITFGVEGVTQAALEQAARVANAYDFIMQKEEGFETNIGDRGSKLSGGERQRLTIARAVLKNAPILILDEATSSLDTESERLVQDAINNMMQNRTTLVIAHRLSTIRHADEIIVLQRGRIVERGTHDELIALDGYYRKLSEMQYVV